MLFFHCSNFTNSQVPAEMDAVKLMKELKVNYEQEASYLPKETGLSLIESTEQVRSADPSLHLSPGNVLPILNFSLFPCPG